MRVTIGDSGLCCCVCVTYFERCLTPLCVDSCVVVQKSPSKRSKDCELSWKGHVQSSYKGEVKAIKVYTDLHDFETSVQKSRTDYDNEQTWSPQN